MKIIVWQRSVCSLTLVTCDTDGPTPVLVDQAPDHGPRHEVDPAQEAAHPGHGALVWVEVVAERGEQDTEAVGDPVQYHVAEEAGGAHYPAPAAVWRGGRHQVLLLDNIICGCWR